MEESTNTEVSSRRVKRLTDTSLNKTTLKSDGECRKVIPNGTGNSSLENLSQEESPKKVTPRTIQITKVAKSPKTDHSKEVLKSPQKVVLSPVKTTTPTDSPSSSKLSKDGFQGFEDNFGEKQGEKKNVFQNFIDNLESEQCVTPDGSSEGEDAAAEEREMTVDAGQTSDTDSNQMEIDTGSDKVHDKTGDSDVEVLDVLEEQQPKKKKAITLKIESEIVAKPNLKGSSAKVEYCGGCEAVVNDSEEGICCDGTCERWFHLRCSGLTQPEYDELGLDENAKWACNKCSGRPPTVIPAGAKPLLSVRKDLTKPTIKPVSAKRKSVAKDTTPRNSRVDISNPAFLKPFDFGWKRELVYRSTVDNTPNNKRHGDIYYYTPKGKKLRSLREILDHLTGTELTQDNFTFHKEPLGLDPGKEIIRDAKLKIANRDPLSTPSPIAVKKVTPKITKAVKPVKPVTPKVTPKLTATVSPLDSGGSAVSKASASVTPRVVLKGGRPSVGSTVRTKVTPNNKTQASTSQSQKDKKKKQISEDELEMGMLPPMWEPLPKQKDNKLSTDVCSIRCLPAMGLIPTLQCVVCLCLFHPQCVGLSEEPSRDYKCKNCLLEKSKPAASTNGTKTFLLPPPLVPITTLSSSTSVSNSVPSPPKLQRMVEGKLLNSRRPPASKTTSLVGGVTTWLPPSSTVHMRGQTPLSKFSPSQKPLPPTTAAIMEAANQPVQTLVTMDGKRFIVVPKHNVLSVSPATTSGVTSDPISTQVTTAAFDTNTTLASQSYGSVLPKSQASPGPTLIVGSSTSPTSSFQKPPGVLLVPYIAPQTSPTPMDGQQPQYIVVNGPSSLTPGNIIIGNIPQQQQMKLSAPQSAAPSPDCSPAAGSKRPLESSEGTLVAKRIHSDKPAAPAGPEMSAHLLQNLSHMYHALLHSFQYLKVQELLRCSRVNHLWRDAALHYSLWETVRMKNSQVKDWDGFSATLQRVGTKHLDLRKILFNEKPEKPGPTPEAGVSAFWNDCIKALSKVHSLVKLDLCRCTSTLLEQITLVCPQLECFTATTIKNGSVVNLINLGSNLKELKLKAQGSMSLSNWQVLEKLTKLRQLSITTIKNMDEVLPVIGKMTQLESLELGECTNISEASVVAGFSNLSKLKRLRLERGQEECPTDKMMETISKLPSLVQLELINFDVKGRFDESLGLISNIKILLIIPTYVTQSATTNHLVINGIKKLAPTLNHFIWGLTLELLRVTDLFIDQWELRQKNPALKTPAPKKISGDSIPILKPAGALETSGDSKENKKGKDVTQVDVLQLPKLHRVLSAMLPTTKIILLKVPFSATWRQTIASTIQ